jgi:hypothetical protein
MYDLVSVKSGSVKSGSVKSGSVKSVVVKCLGSNDVSVKSAVKKKNNTNPGYHIIVFLKF